MGRSAAAALLVLAGCAVAPVPEPPPPAAVPAPPTAAAATMPAQYPEPEALRSLFGEDYEHALASVGLDRRSARCSPAELSVTGVGRFPTPLYQALMGDPTLTDRWSRTLREQAFASAGSVESSSMFAATRLGVIVRLGLLGDPLAEEVKKAEAPGALEEALGALGASHPPSAEPVPARVRAAAALVLRAAARAVPWIDRALPVESRGRDNLNRDSLRIRAGEAADATVVLSGKDEDAGVRGKFEHWTSTTDLRCLARAAAEIGLAVDRASEWLAKIKDTGPFDYFVWTPLGLVSLRGSRDDADAAADPRPILLRIDIGGNDRHTSGAAASPSCPVSVLLDVSGNDTYEAPADSAAFGAGHFGVGLLVDLAGNDRYVLKGPRSLGLGAGVFGVGALLDAGGDDVYEGDGFCEGAGACGWGTLTDLGGRDRYEAFRYSQGFGFVQGAGVLTDLGGNDVYRLNDADLRFPSAQSKEHNDSLGQGFGFGVRADYLDGHSLAGGVGILADREGDDTYSCGVFGQGAGYWMGVGMLLDGAGKDRYDGAWYVQGACAHYAVGILEDAGGDDVYRASLNMAQGAGHDFSLGVLLDRAGNDDYAAPNLSLGGGNSDGMGVLVDGGGNDAYASRGITLGLAAMEAGPSVPTIRHGALTLGVFLDLGGTDRYLAPDGTPQPFAGDGRLWRQAEREGKPAFSNTRGVGLDR